MINPNTTTALAIWGAVTGTVGTVAGVVGLWLRFRQQGQDKRRLRCKSFFGFDSPSHPTHHISVQSLGKRPVTLDHIRYYMIPRRRWHRLTKWVQYKRGRWLCKQEPRKVVKLTDGEKSELRISLPNGADVYEVCKVAVVDQTGEAWKVQWPRHRELLRIATSEKLEVMRQEEGVRNVLIIGHRLGEKYFIETQFNGQGSGSGQVSGRGFWFVDKGGYQTKWANIKEQQVPAFLSGEINELT